jgi:hypothetical protein
VLLVDDHLALLALAGTFPEGSRAGPVMTTWAFQFRLARAVADSARAGSLSRALSDPSVALRRVLGPPADRLIVLDPRSSAEHSVRIAVEHGADLLLADLVGAALQHGAQVRVTPPNVGRAWRSVMEAEGIDFETVDVIG